MGFENGGMYTILLLPCKVGVVIVFARLSPQVKHNKIKYEKYIW